MVERTFYRQTKCDKYTFTGTIGSINGVDSGKLIVAGDTDQTWYCNYYDVQEIAPNTLSAVALFTNGNSLEVVGKKAVYSNAALGFEEVRLEAPVWVKMRAGGKDFVNPDFVPVIDDGDENPA